MKTMKKVSLAILTLGFFFAVTSVFAQSSAKTSQMVKGKPVYQIFITSGCDGNSDGPTDCEPSNSQLSAGNDDVICSSESYELNGTSPKQVKVLWKTSGDGKFDNPYKLDAVYTPGKYDKFIGSVVLYLNELSKPGDDMNVQHDSMVLSLENCVGVPDADPEN